MSTVLVIDDEIGILQIIRQALTKFGHHVETAGDGQEGIRKFDDATVSLSIYGNRINNRYLLLPFPEPRG